MLGCQSYSSYNGSPKSLHNGSVHCTPKSQKKFKNATCSWRTQWQRNSGSTQYICDRSLLGEHTFLSTAWNSELVRKVSKSDTSLKQPFLVHPCVISIVYCKLMIDLDRSATELPQLCQGFGAVHFGTWHIISNRTGLICPGDHCRNHWDKPPIAEGDLALTCLASFLGTGHWINSRIF